MTASATTNARDTSARDTSAAYEVGYGKPPRHTQFRKGQSGNPGGQPRGLPVQRANALLLEEAYRPVAIKENGRMVPVTALQAILRSQVELAINGNYRAQRDILKAVQHLELLRSIGAYDDPYIDDEPDEIHEYGQEDASGDADVTGEDDADAILEADETGEAHAGGGAGDTIEHDETGASGEAEETGEAGAAGTAVTAALAARGGSGASGGGPPPGPRRTCGRAGDVLQSSPPHNDGMGFTARCGGPPPLQRRHNPGEGAPGTPSQREDVQRADGRNPEKFPVNFPVIRESPAGHPGSSPQVSG